MTSQTEIVRQYFSENDRNREFVPQSSSTLTADISRTKTNFFRRKKEEKIPSKPFSGLQNLFRFRDRG